MDEEFKKCLKIHGMCMSDEDLNSSCESLDFDETYKLLKPPPLPIDINKLVVIKTKSNDEEHTNKSLSPTKSKKSKKKKSKNKVNETDKLLKPAPLSIDINELVVIKTKSNDEEHTNKSLSPTKSKKSKKKKSKNKVNETDKLLKPAPLSIDINELVVIKTKNNNEERATKFLEIDISPTKSIKSKKRKSKNKPKKGEEEVVNLKNNPNKYQDLIKDQKTYSENFPSLPTQKNKNTIFQNISDLAQNKQDFMPGFSRNQQEGLVFLQDIPENLSLFNDKPNILEFGTNFYTDFGIISENEDNFMKFYKDLSENPIVKSLPTEITNVPQVSESKSRQCRKQQNDNEVKKSKKKKKTAENFFQYLENIRNNDKQQLKLMNGLLNGETDESCNENECNSLVNNQNFPSHYLENLNKKAKSIENNQNSFSRKNFLCCCNSPEISNPTDTEIVLKPRKNNRCKKKYLGIFQVEHSPILDNYLCYGYDVNYLDFQTKYLNWPSFALDAEFARDICYTNLSNTENEQIREIDEIKQEPTQLDFDEKLKEIEESNYFAQFSTLLNCLLNELNCDIGDLTAKLFFLVLLKSVVHGFLQLLAHYVPLCMDQMILITFGVLLVKVLFKLSNS